MEDHNYRFLKLVIDRGAIESERASMESVVKFLQSFTFLDVVNASDQNGFDWKHANVAL